MNPYSATAANPYSTTGSAVLCDSPVKRTQVDVACERLFETLSNLDLTVTDLDKKLQRVMRCEPATPCKEGQPQTPYSTPMATDIQSATDKVHDSCKRLRRMLDLLEV